MNFSRGANDLNTQGGATAWKNRSTLFTRHRIAKTILEVWHTFWTDRHLVVAEVCGVVPNIGKLKISICMNRGQRKCSWTRIQREAVECLERRDECRRKRRPVMQLRMLSCKEGLHRGTSSISNTCCVEKGRLSCKAPCAQGRKFASVNVFLACGGW